MAVYHLAVTYSPELDTLVYDRRLRPGSGSRLYGLEVCRSLYLPVEFLDAAHRLRIKYFPETRGELANPVSRYNAQKVRSLCEMCNKALSSEVHHLEMQQNADKDGFIDGGAVHKNHKANLMALCEQCHQKVHGDNSKMVKKKTLDGYASIKL